MEVVELKKIMEAYDNQLDETLQLKKTSIQLEKPEKNTNRTLLFRISEVVVFSFLALLSGWYIANNWGQTHLVISGIILHGFTIIALIGSIGQVVLLQQIDYSKPIVEIRKKIERVNSHGLLFVKLMFLSAAVWWSYAIVAIDVFLGVDLFLYLKPDFVQRYLIINFLLIIPILWAFNKLSYKNLHISWVRKAIRFLTGEKTIIALESLNHIEEFEK